MAEFVLMATNSFLSRFLLVGGIFILVLLVLEGFTGRPRPVGRFTFGFYYMFSAVVQYILPSVFLTVATEDVDVAAVVWLGITAILMGGLAYFSRRRSVDAYGETSNAFFAIVPLINLILLFKKPVNIERVSSRSHMALAGRILLFSLSILAAIFVGSFVKVVFDTANRNASINIADLPIRRAVRIEAELLKANMPQIVDAETMLTGASANELELVLEYYLSGGSAELTTEIFEALMLPMVARNVCGDPTFGDLIQRGATIKFDYRAFSEKNGMQYHSLEIRSDSCR